MAFVGDPQCRRVNEGRKEWLNTHSLFNSMKPVGRWSPMQEMTNSSVLLGQWFLKSVAPSQHHEISTPRGDVRKASSWAPPQTYWVRNSGGGTQPMNSSRFYRWFWCLRTTAPYLWCRTWSIWWYLHPQPQNNARHRVDRKYLLNELIYLLFPPTPIFHALDTEGTGCTDVEEGSEFYSEDLRETFCALHCRPCQI